MERDMGWKGIWDGCSEERMDELVGNSHNIDDEQMPQNREPHPFDCSEVNELEFEDQQRTSISTSRGQSTRRACQ
jgi:hypothetical protein